ncbi:MAG: ArsC/Spx/MgsR family protein [Lachnospiraceae bacterium]|nr:glutaredoxin domain-containing protein [Lachnospiraceae bacterium]MDY5742303.1 ArsC/Spx/MgsR family protein [Lachnospiraceae bacterium]
MTKVMMIGYKKCSTCTGVERMLQERGIGYDYREIDKENPTVEELKQWQQKSGLPLKRFFNNSGLIYRGMGLSKKLPTMSEDEQFELLATDGKLVKRPIVLTSDKIYVGPDVKKWLTAMKG